jgi:hypothetical protein
MAIDVTELYDKYEDCHSLSKERELSGNILKKFKICK